MKFYKAFGLLAATAGLLLTGCGDGTTSDKEIVKEAADTDALIISGSGTSFSSKRVNELPYKRALYLANSMSASAKVKDSSGNVISDYVLTSVTWKISGDGASLWKHNSVFDDETNDYQYWTATYPESGDKVAVTFTATITYGKASAQVDYKFLMTPKA